MDLAWFICETAKELAWKERVEHAMELWVHTKKYLFLPEKDMVTMRGEYATPVRPFVFHLERGEEAAHRVLSAILAQQAVHELGEETEVLLKLGRKGHYIYVETVKADVLELQQKIEPVIKLLTRLGVGEFSTPASTNCTQKR